MSGTEDFDPDLLAAEYVLGTLEGRERESVAYRAQSDDVLNSAILAWEMRLAPLGTLVPPISPPSDLWLRIEESCGLAVPSRRGRLRTSLWDRVNLWRGATGLGFGLAVALAALVVFRTPSSTITPVGTAVLSPTPGAAPTFVAEIDQHGVLVMQPLTHLAVADDKDLELWALPDGQTVPQPLGVMKASGRSVSLPPALRKVPMQIMISLEQHGGSTTGLPQGPVLFVGHISKFD
ncbi:anti-sigma factor [Acidisoma cladoniae]|jgi:anti-sigma-K factor RskA|uniref:anti-sigma factor n=1 Tax=Acidisoma cladoniae TaxID=3040935 RepID=UPI00254B39D8|nr:anti-sigma factor [Acidisoma sp. PAMC 29798]